MAGHLRFMKQQGMEVTAVSSPGAELDAVAHREGVAVAPVSMRRAISPLHDLVALWRLVRLMRSARPDIVNAGTPKAGLLCMLASRLVGVPVRIYTVRGLRGETATGLKCKLLEATERLASWCATDVLCVSPSLRQIYIERGLARPEKTTVLGHGSSNGVDFDRFWSSPSRRQRARSALGLGDDSLVVGFVGRLVRDKGVGELVDAFELVRKRVPDAVLVLAGDYEDGDPVGAKVRRLIAGASDIIHLGHVQEMADVYPAFDVLAFPSAREGLPNAPLEAAANAIPTVAFDATGTRDVIVHGCTGMLLPRGDVRALADGLAAYLEDRDRWTEHGEAALKLAAERFDRSAVWNNLLDFYRLRRGATAFGGDVDSQRAQESSSQFRPGGKTSRQRGLWPSDLKPIAIDLSVIIPTVDRPELAARAVWSCFESTVQVKEVIIVHEDPSRVASYESLYAELGELPVRRLVHAHRRGPSAARNNGWRAAKGSWVYFLDDDDQLIDGGLSVIAQALAARPDDRTILAFGSRIIRTDGVREQLPGPTMKKYGSPFWAEIGTLAIQKSCLEEVGGFDAAIELGENRDLMARLAARFEVQPIDEVTVLLDYGHPEPRLSNTQGTIEANVHLLHKNEAIYRSNQQWWRSAHLFAACHAARRGDLGTSSTLYREWARSADRLFDARFVAALGASTMGGIRYWKQ